MAVTTCNECRGVIPFLAKRCKHCGALQSTGGGGLDAVSVLYIGFFGLWAYGASQLGVFEDGASKTVEVFGVFGLIAAMAVATVIGKKLKM